MDFLYRKLLKADYSQAVELTLRVFDEFEAPVYPAEGVETFHKLMSDEKYLEEITIYGAFTGETLAGIIATRCNGNHITLFFVDKSYHRQGIGRHLFELVKADNTTGTITVNSSPYAVEIYKRLGFTQTGPEEISDGIRFTHMEYKENNMEFCVAGKNDIPQLTELRIAYLKEDLKTVSADDEKILEEKLPVYFEEHLNRDCIAFVARSGNVIASAALLVIIEKPASPKFINGLTGEVLSVYTRPECRHQGLCSNLMKKLVEYARENGLNKVELKATDEGYPIYKKAGFTDAVSEYKPMIHKF